MRCMSCKLVDNISHDVHSVYGHAGLESPIPGTNPPTNSFSHLHSPIAPPPFKLNKFEITLFTCRSFNVLLVSYIRFPPPPSHCHSKSYMIPMPIYVISRFLLRLLYTPIPTLTISYLSVYFLKNLRSVVRNF